MFSIPKIFDRVFLKFALVGLFNTVAGAVLMFLLYNSVGLGYWLSSAVSYCAGSALGFFLNKYFTFKVKQWSFKMIAAYILTIAVSWFLAYKIARMAVVSLFEASTQNIRDNIALFTGMCLFTGMNYISQRFFVFRK
ncbi:MAG: GtrA family protein [Spirochaetaceae bacterium]|jgi:putative flippase GtrA|nr:GtrA family protein [Spirochaetaceae bacterium]